MNSAAATALVGITAIVTTVAALAILVPVLRSRGVIDEPNYRSSHTGTAVRGAGLALSVGAGAGWIVAGLVGYADGFLNLIMATGILAAAIGFTEDVRGLTTSNRLIAQLGIGLGFAVAVTDVAESQPWLIPVMAVCVAGYINAANFMDGVDSISALHGIVAGGYFAVLGGISEHLTLTLAGVVLVAVFACFAPWNLGRNSRVFLGDVGSYLLGGIIASCAGVAYIAGTGLLAALAPMLPYLADTSFTMFQRAVRRERLTQPHRSHIYQRLAARGWSHLAVGTTVATASLLSCAVALVGYAGVVGSLVTLICQGGVVVAYVILPSLASRRDLRRTFA